MRHFEDLILKLLFIHFINLCRLSESFGSDFSEEKTVNIKNKFKQSNQPKPDEKRLKKSETKPYQLKRSKNAAKNNDEHMSKQEDDQIKYVKSCKF